MMRDVPEPAERERLLDALARLAELAGPEAFLARPLVLATPTFFPEPVPATIGGVRALLRRFLVYAGLQDLQPTLQVYAAGDETHSGLVRGLRRKPHEDVPAFFAGIQNDTAFFGFHHEHFRDGDRLLGILAHEVAHAFRSSRGIEMRDRAVEEELTDLTAVFLGFGALLVNASFVHRSEGEQLGAYSTHRVEITRTGYLPAESLAFAFAVQLTLRATDEDERAEIMDELDRDRAASVRACLRALPARDELATRLRLPAPATWPGAIEVDTDELAAVDDQEDDDARLDGSDPERSAQAITYRVPAWRGVSGVIVGSLFAAGVGLLLATAFGVPSFVLMLLVFAAGALVPSMKLHSCADRECNRMLFGHPSHCPGCRRPIAGDLATAADWLEAEREATAPQRSSKPVTPRRKRRRSADRPEAGRRR